MIQGGRLEKLHGGAECFFFFNDNMVMEWIIFHVNIAYVCILHGMFKEPSRWRWTLELHRCEDGLKGVSGTRFFSERNERGGI